MDHTREMQIRHKLGIPDDAQRVIMFAESSHWDPNWLHTAGEYYRRFVGPNLDAALDELTQEPRRVYSVECAFFLRMYWERRPEKQDQVRQLINDGRLQLTSSGVTTADTLLPSTEAILRDFLIGQEWLRANGMTQEPRLAYFADSFGCSPALPSLLRAAGFDRTAITRIDGMHFVGADLERAKNFPRAGSSAAHLLRDEKSLDFIWRDTNGASVLCHWNAFNYGQGDMLAHRGITRIYLFRLAIPDRSERSVARRIKQYVGQLAPVSRTPYLFCPIGFDFVEPIPDLVGLLDRYNRVRYPDTGVWALNAGLDDYLDLVDTHREDLPVLELDPNPYWTGFYTARPALKRRCHELVELLLRAEQLALLPERTNWDLCPLQELREAWWHAVTANHHDFITGTSPDAVVEGEQWPWLNHAVNSVNGVIQRLSPPAPQIVTPRPVAPRDSLPLWEQQAGTVWIETPHYLVELSEDAGGCIVRAWSPEPEQKPLLVGPSNDLVSYADSGGLWRMGHEYRGGYLKATARASQRPASLQVQPRAGGLEVVCTAELDGETVRRSLWFSRRSPLIYGRLEGRAAARRTVSLLFATDLSAGEISMAQPGGVVTRTSRKLYDPTFWPLQEFAHVQDQTQRHGLAVFVNAPGAIASHDDGRIELVALRNATRERAYRVIPLLANPAEGYEREAYTLHYAILFTAAGDWRANQFPRLARETLRHPWEGVEHAALHQRTASLVTVTEPNQRPADVAVIALKPASRGEGLILRLYALAVPQGEIGVALRDQTIRAAYLCDARERDLVRLTVTDGRVALSMPGSIATLRLLLPGS